MDTCTIRNMDYQGPTRNPNGEHLDRLTRRYSQIRSKAAFKRLAALWGLIPKHQKQARG